MTKLAIITKDLDYAETMAGTVQRRFEQYTDGTAAIISTYEDASESSVSFIKGEVNTLKRELGIS